jgi:hypothetical protein
VSPVYASVSVPQSHDDLGTLLVKYDYPENRQGIAGFHVDGFAGSLSDEDALHLATMILRSQAHINHRSGSRFLH